MAIIFVCLVIENTSSLQYNRGRRAARDTWVFGMVTAEFSPARGYFEVVDRRDAATPLHPIISRCVRAGTEVHTDDWASYRNLDQRVNNAGVHQVVVHRRNFDDPATGVHTQEMESCWNNLKLGLKKRRGIKREDMQAYLDEQMWRQWRGGPHEHVVQNFLSIFPLQYLVTNPVL